MNWQPPPPGGQAQSPGAQQVSRPDLNYYELLQVDRDAHPTVIRYAYRFLAAMYHPDNAETGNADKFRIVTEAWKTLSDEGKRSAYDLSLGIKDQAKAQGARSQEKPPEFGRASLPEMPKTTLTWNEIELRLAILQVLLAARKHRPQTGGASAKMLMDCLNIAAITEIEFVLWYLREKGYIEMGERAFMITASGVDYLTDRLGQTEVLGGGSATERKTTEIIKSSMPAAS